MTEEFDTYDGHSCYSSLLFLIKVILRVIVSRNYSLFKITTMNNRLTAAVSFLQLYLLFY